MSKYTSEACPVCGRVIRVYTLRSTMAAHCDKTNKRCPMSGKQIGLSA